MKKCKSIRNLIISIFWIMVGATLIVLGVVETLDEFWSGFGGGLVAVGILQLVRNIRYRTNDDYKEKVDTEINDERNQFISSQAWAWTGYIFIICCAIATVTFSVMDKEDLCHLCATGICLMAVIRFVAYLILKRKY